MNAPSFTVVIPIGPGEDSWPVLLEDLLALPFPFAIVFAATSPCPARHAIKLTKAAAIRPVDWIHDCDTGRAAQMNHAAAVARSDWLLFLHADTRVTIDTWRALVESVNTSPMGLHYFNLHFDWNSWRMRLSEMGVRMRCRTWGMPYGDQGFAVKKTDFKNLGGFPLITPGEDHAFAWICHNAGMPIKCTGGSVTTSSRKYRDRGWGAVALQHNLLGIKQAVYFRFLRPARQRSDSRKP